MNWQKMILDFSQRQGQELEKVLDGLTQEELNRQPAPGQNSIGWTLWHAIRSLDRNFSPMLGEEQIWITEKWHAKFGRIPDPGETGFGHTPEQARNFKSPEGEVFLDYYKAITEKVENYVNNKLTEIDLSREVYITTLKTSSTIGQIFVTEEWHTAYHIGQAGYARGMVTKPG